IDINGVMTEGAQLRFAVDGQPGITDVCWLVINQRLVQLFFMRPEKNATKAAISCNKDLEAILSANLNRLIEGFDTFDFIELNRINVIFHM
ncbi:MAG TPA: hypothetical protein VJ124_13730, partial [Pyrinomonadaceae bacterium]|nr:hypothetical protein [Pyrinomonadaceae bacterium]